MKEFNESEYNRLCAEFLGFKYVKSRKSYNIEQAVDNSCVFHNHSVDNDDYYWIRGKNVHFIHENCLMFDSCWNWIMEVLEKVESTKLKNRFDKEDTWNLYTGKEVDLSLGDKVWYAGFTGFWHSDEYLDEACRCSSKKEAVVKAIWYFLNRYNDQQNKSKP